MSLDRRVSRRRELFGRCGGRSGRSIEFFSIDVGSIGLSYRVSRSIWARSTPRSICLPGECFVRCRALPGSPGGDFGANFRCFLTVRVRSHLFAQQKQEFSSKFAKFSTCAPLRRAIWTRPTRCLLNVSMFAKKRASRLEKPRKTSKILPKST